MTVKVSASILSCDFANLLQDIKQVEKSGADLLHIDVMDGSFVKNITLGPVVIQSIRGKVDIPFDVHLMIVNPLKHLDAFIKAGADFLGFHVETCSIQEQQDIIKKAKDNNIRPYPVLNPDTSISAIKDILSDIDFVLLMSVYPGFAGQSFLPEVLFKIAELRKMSPNIDINVDGGINAETAKQCIAVGANILTAGSYIFSSKDYKKAINSLKG